MATERAEPLELDERLDEVVVAYLEAVERGEVPDRSEWLARFPEFAAQLAEFFADQDRVKLWTETLPEVAQSAQARRANRLATTRSSKKLPEAAWGSFTRPGRSASSGALPSR